MIVNNTETCLFILLLMASLPYLIAIALTKQDKKRAMPIGGKSLKAPISEDNDPGHFGEAIALELLLRLFQKSDETIVSRVAGNKSLLLVEISMENMHEKLKLKMDSLEAPDARL